MTRVGWLDLNSGLSGDMFLGALVGAGADPAEMERAVQAVGGARLKFSRQSVMRGGLSGVFVEVLLDGEPILEGGGPAEPFPDDGPGDAHGGSAAPTAHVHTVDHPHRSHAEIVRLITTADLSPVVRERALAVFAALAQAEASVHGASADNVHFHEVGSWDAIADVVGVAAGITALGLERIYHGPVSVGGGVARGSHGELPVPAPATLRLLTGRPCVFEPGAGELITPTGAALLCALTQPAPTGFAMVPQSVGYGAGRKNPPARPNLARLTVGEVSESVGTGRVAVVEATLDDATPEEGGDLISRLLEDGALDVTLTPTLMKKSRPGFLVRVLAPAEKARHFAEAITKLSPSLGARWRVEERVEMARRIDRVRLPEGEVRVKVALHRDGSERPHPEHDDIAAIARARGAALGDVRREVEQAWEAAR